MTEVMTINGAAVAGTQFFDVVNPSTGKPFAKCVDATKEQLDAAVRAAEVAFPKWAATQISERKKCLLAAAKVINDNVEPLAVLLATEQGKPLQRARDECRGAAYWFVSTAGLDIADEPVKTKAGDVRVVKRPLGVVGGITPWNFPVMLACWKIAPATLAGNTFVLKPSPYTPLSSLRLGQLLAKAFPPGVVNVIAGGDSLGVWMTQHPTIRKISFTGSTATGKKIREVTAKDLKVCTLELGGNDAAILLPGINAAAVAPQIFASAFANTGQVCSAIKRVYVHESQYEQVVQELAKAAAKAKFGAFDEAGVEYGPLNNKMQFDKVKSLVDDARRRGGRIVTGGAPIDRPGFFFQPTIVADVAEGFALVDEEQFGPALPVLKYATVDEAIARANNTIYGLGASVWAADKSAAEAIADRLDAGTVWVNSHLVLDPTIPFGGVKQSGLGRENGAHGLDEYLQIKAINVAKL